MLSQQDRLGIAVVREKLVNAILDGDVDAYVESFAADCVLIHPERPQVRGEAAIRAHATAAFSAVKITELQLTPIVVDGGGGFAFEVGVQHIAVEPSDGEIKTERQHLHVYAKQGNGSWRVLAAMTGIL